MALTRGLDAQTILDTLGMAPHPEGGWYAEMYRDSSAPGSRSAVTAIYFLLRQGERSHWHRVDACEIWLWHAGAPGLLHLAQEGPKTETIVLGVGLDAGQRPQAIVPAGVWQEAETTGAWSLFSCVVAPGFEFAGFTMAPPGWTPG